MNVPENEPWETGAMHKAWDVLVFPDGKVSIVTDAGDVALWMEVGGESGRAVAQYLADLHNKALNDRLAEARV